MAKSRNRRVQDDTADDAVGVLVGELVDGFDGADDKAVAAAVLVEELVDAFDVDTVVAAADDGVADSGEEPVVGGEREEWPRCLQELDGLLSRAH